MPLTRFTENKQVVRGLQGRMIEKYFKNKLGKLKYFGLPSDEMKDILDWTPFFSYFTAVERGIFPNNWEKQHLLILSAFKNNILDRLDLLRGDIDEIISSGKDDYGTLLDYPFDIVNLDYSGGLLYRNEREEQYRLGAIRKLIQKQAQSKISYLLFISSNLDNCKDVEIQRTLTNIKTELLRYGANGEKVINAYLDHEKDEVRLKIYIPYFINQIASGVNYNCETRKIIFYVGNLNVRMMNFRFYLKYGLHITAPRFPKERLSQIINSPMIEIKEGEYKEVTLGLPKLRRIEY